MQGVGAVTAPAEFQVPPAQLPGPTASCGPSGGPVYLSLDFPPTEVGEVPWRTGFPKVFMK